MLTDASSRLIPLRSMARRLGVPATWLRAEVDAGRVPALVAGRAYVCDSEAVEQALLDRARTLRTAHESAKEVLGAS